MVGNTTAVKTRRVRSSSLGGLALVSASIVAHRLLANTVRIRWTVSTHHHYGPEYTPTTTVFIAFPLLVAGLYVGAQWLKSYLETRETGDEFDDIPAIYNTCVLLTLGTVVTVQLAIIILYL